jgi:hypothetical protein
MQSATTITTITCDACGEKSIKRANGYRFSRRRRRRNSWRIESMFMVDLCAPCKLSISKMLAAWRRSRKYKARKSD